MSRGVNKVILVGNLGQDPILRYSASGAAVANLSLATQEEWKDKQTGEKKTQTEWHRIIFYNKIAEICGEYLKKGSKIYVEGSLKTRKWQDKNTNQDRYTTEIQGRDMQMLDGKNNADDAVQNPSKTQEDYKLPEGLEDDLPF